MFTTLQELIDANTVTDEGMHFFMPDHPSGPSRFTELRKQRPDLAEKYAKAVCLKEATGSWANNKITLLHYVHNYSQTTPEMALQYASELIASGADVNALDENGDTPLMSNSNTKSGAKFVELLVNAGADVNYINANPTRQWREH